MSQKFISLDDAAEQLGVTKDRLNQLRENGDLRAYRDGASWKFRTEEIDKLGEEGVPSEAGDDTLSAGGEYGLSDPPPLEDPPPLGDPIDESNDSNEETLQAGAPIEGADDDGDDDDIGLGVEPLAEGDDAESILLTGDDSLEGGIPRPASTIIGKSELSLEDDLELASASDAKQESGSGSALEDLDELELDLEAEASRITEEKPAAAEQPAAEESELELDLASGSSVDSSGDGSSDILGGGASGPDLAGSAGSIAGLSGIDSVELSDDDDDDMVLGGSDDNLGFASGGSDSGINLAPSDSGIALDEVPLDLGGSAIGSALDLAALSAASGLAGGQPSGVGPASSAAAEDFQLTPTDAGDDDDEDSSQIVALEEVSEDEEELPGFEPADDDDDDGGGFGGASGLQSGIGAGTEAGAAPVVIGSGQEITFPTWVVALLGASAFAMALCGLMAMDLLQSMWAWDEPFALTSPVMDGLLSLVGG